MLRQSDPPANGLGPPGRSVPTIPADYACGHCEIRDRTFCAVLDPEELARFKQLGPTVRVQAGQSLFHEGEAADLVYNITAGTVRLYRMSADGQRQIAGFLYAGDCLGLTPEGEHTFSAEAIEPSEFCRIPRARFEAFMATRPELHRELYLLTDRELAKLRDQIVVLGRRNAAERIANFLLQRFDRSRGAADGPEIVRLPMDRSDVADYLGFTKETICRSFSALRRDGLIASRPGHRIELLRRAALERLAAPTAYSA